MLSLAALTAEPHLIQTICSGLSPAPHCRQNFLCPIGLAPQDIQAIACSETALPQFVQNGGWGVDEVESVMVFFCGSNGLPSPINKTTQERSGAFKRWCSSHSRTWCMLFSRQRGRRFPLEVRRRSLSEARRYSLPKVIFTLQSSFDCEANQSALTTLRRRSGTNTAFELLTNSNSIARQRAGRYFKCREKYNRVFADCKNPCPKVNPCVPCASLRLNFLPQRTQRKKSNLPLFRH